MVSSGLPSDFKAEMWAMAVEHRQAASFLRALANQ